MRFGLFWELQLPRPWDDGAEQRAFSEGLEQLVLGDQLGLDYAWMPEHHFLEEFSHSSAPELLLAAASQRTRTIRLGHAVMLMPPPYNPPIRCAERIATLDLLSNGRAELGTGEASSALELGGFGVPRGEKRAMWREAVEQVCRMLVMQPYPGHEGKYFSAPCRNVVPKPLQKPHPPLWVACTSDEMILTAARYGMGALCFSFQNPAAAARWVDLYYTTLKRECVPIGYAINPNIAMVSGFSCHADPEEALRRGLDGFRFFGYGLNHYYVHGAHKPGHTDLWSGFEQIRAELPDAGRRRGLGSPAELADELRAFEQAGVDQVIFIQQAGRNRHDEVCESLSLFAREVMPAFKDRHAAREQRKLEALAPFLERALAAKELEPPLTAAETPAVDAREGGAGRSSTFGGGLAPRPED